MDENERAVLSREGVGAEREHGADRMECDDLTTMVDYLASVLAMAMVLE